MEDLTIGDEKEYLQVGKLRHNGVEEVVDMSIYDSYNHFASDYQLGREEAIRLIGYLRAQFNLE